MCVPGALDLWKDIKAMAIWSDNPSFLKKKTRGCFLYIRIPLLILLGKSFYWVLGIEIREYVGPKLTEKQWDTTNQPDIHSMADL